MLTFKLQRWSAIALLVFLTLHMIVTHYVSPYHIDFNFVYNRLQFPIWKIRCLSMAWPAPTRC